MLSLAWNSLLPFNLLLLVYLLIIYNFDKLQIFCDKKNDCKYIQFLDFESAQSGD